MYSVLKAKYKKELTDNRMPLRYGMNLDVPILYERPKKKLKTVVDLYTKEEIEERFEIFKSMDTSSCLSNNPTRKQTISMTLEKALFHQDGKIKKAKIDRVVSGILRSVFWVYLFLNWYAQETGNLYPIADQCQTSITFLIYYFIRCESRGRKLYGSQVHLLLNRFATMYPNSRLIDLSDIKIDLNTFNSSATSIMNACKLYHKLLNEDPEFYIKKIKKSIVSRQFMSWESNHITPTKAIKDDLYSRSRNISRALVKLELKFRPSHDALSKVNWLRQQVYLRDPRCADLYLYPTSQFKVDRLTIDLKTMQSSFGNTTQWDHHFDAKKMNMDPSLLKTMKTIKTDGFTVQFVLEKRREVEYNSKERTRFPLHEWNKESNVEEKLVPVVDYPIDKPTFGAIKNYSTLPKKNGMRLLNKLNRGAIDTLKQEPMVCIDPGIKFVCCAKAGDNIVCMSSGRHHHLLMTNKFRKYDQLRKRPIQSYLDALSVTRTLDTYLEAVDNGFVVLSNVFGDLEYRKWRFRRDSLRRKIDDLVYMELMTGKKQCSNFYFNDKRRAKQSYRIKERPKGRSKPVRIQEYEKRNIYWGDGSYGHSKGNAVVPNKRLIYKLCKRARVIVTPEFKTSKLCCDCHHDLRKEMVSVNGQRQRQCPNCFSVEDRDVNSCIKIEQVVISYCSTYEKPKWQELDFDAK
eukprot:NODE_135_length_18075_cov_0.518413.p2 type:complete len:686 gc:universal NODE_135_length_18075_cov_0.518413:3517-1460(-)